MSVLPAGSLSGGKTTSDIGDDASTSAGNPTDRHIVGVRIGAKCAGPLSSNRSESDATRGAPETCSVSDDASVGLKNRDEHAARMPVDRSRNLVGIQRRN